MLENLWDVVEREPPCMVKRGSYPEKELCFFSKNQRQGEGQNNPSEVLIQK